MTIDKVDVWLLISCIIIYLDLKAPQLLAFTQIFHAFYSALLNGRYTTN